MPSDALTERQRREIDYHREYAEAHRDEVDRPINLDVVTGDRRRWWNAYWSTYDMLRALDLRDKRVLVPGCGFGNDALALAHLGAQVHAFDISPEVARIAQERACRLGYERVEVEVMPSESMTYDDDSFDVNYCRDILHHTDIPPTCKELQRVGKAGAHFIGSELYTHSTLQKWVRNNPFVEKVVYPRMVKLIYGTDRPSARTGSSGST